MISYNLRCSKDHEFEGWFNNSASFDEQIQKKKVECPICGDRKIAKALSAPMVASSKSRAAAQVEVARANAQKMLKELRQKVKENCDNVGASFAEEARKIHYGETEKRGIYGQASLDEAKSLSEEGIEISAIPWMEEGTEH